MFSKKGEEIEPVKSRALLMIGQQSNFAIHDYWWLTISLLGNLNNLH